MTRPVFTVQQSMLITHNAAEEALNLQARMNRDLQQALTHIRTVPFSNFAEHFYRVVRQAARDMHKKSILRIQGTTKIIFQPHLGRVCDAGHCQLHSQFCDVAARQK